MAGKLRTIGHKLRPLVRRGPIVIREKTADAFYQSKEWKALMVKIIKERGRRCQDDRHDVAKPSEDVLVYGDHIVEIKDGGEKLDPFNVLLRCATCHGRKTAEARSARYSRA